MQRDTVPGCTFDRRSQLVLELRIADALVVLAGRHAASDERLQPRQLLKGSQRSREAPLRPLKAS